MSGHKAYTRVAIEKRPKWWNEPEITFSVQEATYPDHDDALVISIRIANA